MRDRARLHGAWFAVLVLGLGAGIGCSRSEPAVAPGALYSVVSGDDGFQVAKVLVVDDESVHLRLYKNRFAERPTAIRVEDLSLGSVGDADGFGMGHLPLTRAAFLDCKPVFIEASSIAKDELDGYEMWKSGGGGLFGKR